MAQAPVVLGITVGSGLFYTILYMTIAMLINILVCILAARDTYKRVKHTNNVNQMNKWVMPRQRTSNIDTVNRLMNEHRKAPDTPTLLYDSRDNHKKQNTQKRKTLGLKGLTSPLKRLSMRIVNPSPTTSTTNSHVEADKGFPDTAPAGNPSPAPKNPFLPSPDALMRITREDNLPKLNTWRFCVNGFY